MAGWVDFIGRIDWVAISAPIFTLGVLSLSYIRYRAYVDEVQRDLFLSLEGREYPRFESRHSVDETQFEVVNVDVDVIRLTEWKTTVVLRLNEDEFPWADSDIKEFGEDSAIPEELQPDTTENVDSIEEAMENELEELCAITRKSGSQFTPEFMDSVYGPALMLRFSTTNLFEIREQLEVVSNVLPLLFTGWFQIMMGIDTKFVYGSIQALAEHPEVLEGFEGDIE